jgi:hypothetical protein
MKTLSYGDNGTGNVLFDGCNVDTSYYIVSSIHSTLRFDSIRFTFIINTITRGCMMHLDTSDGSWSHHLILLQYYSNRSISL